jgi:hypothetical protein
MNKQLTLEVEHLKGDGFALQMHPQPDGWVFLVLEDYPLPEGFNRRQTNLLIKVPPNYPLGALDMFWVNPHVLLANGAAPANTCVENYLGQSWLRFSWHPHHWTPSSDNLSSYLKFINSRLEQRQ